MTSEPTSAQHVREAMRIAVEALMEISKHAVENKVKARARSAVYQVNKHMAVARKIESARAQLDLGVKGGE